MTTYTITGPISDVSGAKSRITGAWIRASDTRAAGTGITTEENAPVTISAAGVATFTAAPGPAVLVLSSAGEVVETVPLIIPENNATLGDAARAAALAEESWSAIQGLAKRATDALSGAESARAEAEGHATAAAGSAGAAASSVASLNDTLAGAVADATAGAVADATAVAEGHASAAAGSAGAAASSVASMNDTLAGAVADATAVAEGHADDARGYAEAAEQALTEGIPDGSVTTAKIADGAVTRDKIAAAAVITTKLANYAVTTTKIAGGAVTEAKLSSLAVNTSKLSSLAVTTPKIADGAVTGEKIDPRYRQETSMVEVPLTHPDHDGSGMLRITKIGRLVVMQPEGLLAGVYRLSDQLEALAVPGNRFAQPVSDGFYVDHVEVVYTGTGILISFGIDDLRTPIIYMSANDTPLNPSYIYQE